MKELWGLARTVVGRLFRGKLTENLIELFSSRFADENETAESAKRVILVRITHIDRGFFLFAFLPRWCGVDWEMGSCWWRQ